MKLRKSTMYLRFDSRVMLQVDSGCQGVSKSNVHRWRCQCHSVGLGNFHDLSTCSCNQRLHTRGFRSSSIRRDFRMTSIPYLSLSLSEYT
jgi:hypothetical protein